MERRPNNVFGKNTIVLQDSQGVLEGLRVGERSERGVYAAGKGRRRQQRHTEDVWRRTGLADNGDGDSSRTARYL